MTEETFTHPLYLRCVTVCQWQNAANIRGCSEHLVRMDHDPVYRYEHGGEPLEKPRKARTKAEKPVKPRAAFVAIPAPRTIVEDWTRRRKALGWRTGDLARAVGVSKGGLQNALSSKGHCSPRMRERIEQTLTLAEHPAVCAGRAAA